MSKESFCPAAAYPRSRGATKENRPVCHNGRGLSPLARGNLGAAVLLIYVGGPIPARAGQPLALSKKTASVKAYPRSRGATTGLEGRQKPLQGLSPLARGNLQVNFAMEGQRGPIPARAGQPLV